MNWVSLIVKWLMLVGLLSVIGGCATTLDNQGEVGFRYGTEFTFFHRATATCEESAKSSWSADVEAINALIRKQTEPDKNPPEGAETPIVSVSEVNEHPQEE